MPIASAMAELLRRIAALESPEASDFEQVLRTPLTEVTSANRFFDSFEFAGAPEPLPRGTLRTGRERAKALLTLRPAEGALITRADLDLEAHFGDVDSIDPNPDIPPEGTVAFRYRVGGVPVWFQFTAQSKVLRLVSIEWG